MRAVPNIMRSHTFYSLLQSLELSMTMMNLCDSDEEKRKEVLSNWRSEKHFPMYSGMAKYLQDHESEFKDIKEKLPEFFDETERVKKRLNKYVQLQNRLMCDCHSYLV